MKANQLNILPLSDGSVRVEITLADRTGLEHLVMLANTCTELDVEITKYRKKRTITMNSYLWQFLNKLAAVLRTTKEELYRECVRKVGLFDDIAVPTKAVDGFIRHWKSKGEGWQAEVTEKGKNEGYKVLRVYSGSSVYNREEFSRLIDYVVEECKEQGIETMTPDELAKLKAHVEV